MWQYFNKTNKLSDRRNHVREQLQKYSQKFSHIQYKRLGETLLPTTSAAAVSTANRRESLPPIGSKPSSKNDIRLTATRTSTNKRHRRHRRISDSASTSSEEDCAPGDQDLLLHYPTTIMSAPHSSSALGRIHPAKCLPRRLQPVPAVVAGIMVHLTLGTLYSIGNMVPYLVSYVRIVHGSSATNKDAGWLTAMATIGQGFTLVIGGILERYLGPRLATLIGCFFVSFGTIISYFTIKSSFWACAFSYGLIFGFGVGLAYAPPIVCATRWLPKYKGLVIGCIVGGFGCGALIFNQVQTKYINPLNLKVSPEDGYFHDQDLLDRVPFAFLLLGGCYIAMQLIAFCLMFDAPEDHHELLEDQSSGSCSFNPEFYSLHPLLVLRSPTFHIIWLTFLFNGQVSGFISPYYKLFGETFIEDDSFLATTGSLASVLNALGRIFWGHLADHFSYQVSMACLTALLAFLFLTLQVSVHAGKAFYLIWILLIYFGFSGSFALLPFATVRCFGQAYLGVNYGLVFTSQVVTSVISALLAQKLLGVIDYNGIFFLVALFAFISFILTTCIGVTPHGHPPRDGDKRRLLDDGENRITYASTEESSDTEDVEKELDWGGKEWNS